MVRYCRSNPSFVSLLNVFTMIVVGGVGVGGLLDDQQRRLEGNQLNEWHFGFGVILLALVFLRSFSLLASEGVSLCNLHASARDTARVVYALLYGIFGIDEVSRLGHCVAVWGLSCTTQPSETLRVYLVYGIFAIATTHLLTALLSRASGHRG